jgi:ABC-type thiamine transport system ATPase subunit
MPGKVQLKLLSNSGELLNVATCCAGKISVLRASTPSDLRPYQRALAGSSAKDNLEILCDGAQFHPDVHTLIGFGEPSPTLGLTVKEFLKSRGMSELASGTQLMSFGLDDIADKRCAELTLDQESRLRLLAATSDPDKVLILNDPFDNIAGKWRERVAEVLADFARTRNALIIIPSLSYRPEAWIENNAIERIEVGQTAQRTIGFGSAGSQSNAEIDQIRNQLRADPRFAGQAGPNDQRAAATGALAGMAAGIRPQDFNPMAADVAAKKSLLPVFGKLLFALVGSSVGGWAIYTAVNMPTKSAENNKASDRVAALQQPPAAPEQRSEQPDPKRVANDPQPNVNKPAIPAASQAALVKAPEVQAAYLLDTYPAAIKASILDTVRGNIDFASGSEKIVAEPAPQKQGDSGNLFSLLEKASNSKTEAPNGYTGNPSYIANEEEPAEDNTASMSPEDAQREAIRNRFLEAIRASAARRQAETEEDLPE